MSFLVALHERVLRIFTKYYFYNILSQIKLRVRLNTISNVKTTCTYARKMYATENTTAKTSQTKGEYAVRLISKRYTCRNNLYRYRIQKFWSGSVPDKNQQQTGHRIRRSDHEFVKYLIKSDDGEILMDDKTKNYSIYITGHNICDRYTMMIKPRDNNLRRIRQYTYTHYFPIATPLNFIYFTFNKTLIWEIEKPKCLPIIFYVLLF